VNKDVYKISTGYLELLRRYGMLTKLMSNFTGNSNVRQQWST